MKRTILTFCAIAVILFACNNDKKAEAGKEGSASEDTASKPKEKAWIPVDSAMMDKAWKESMAIGEPHKWLAKGAGTWNGEVTMWMAEGAPPMKSTSTSVNTMLFGGLYQQSKHSGNMMGAPFEGQSTTAYDNTTKEFISTWIDNMGSTMLIARGKWDDPTGKVVKLSGSMTNPANGMECTIREVFTTIDDNNQMLEMYGPDPKTGKEMKTMEIKYTRKK